MKTPHSVLLILALGFTTTLFANECGYPPPPPPPPHHPHGDMKGPPPRFDASLCQDKAAGTVVETTTPDGRIIKGTCQLVFLPDRHGGDEQPR